MSVFSRGTASRSRVRTVIGGIAIAGASALVLAGCSGGGGTAEPSEPAAPAEDLTLKIGTILPQTGSLAFLGPPEEAGVGLAAQDVNDGRDRRSHDRRHRWGDSGDTDNKAYATTIQKLISEGVTAAIGAASSGVTKLFLDDAVAAGIITFSPANTSADFTTWDDNGLYWRTAPSDTLQGEVLGNLIAEDGHKQRRGPLPERLLRHRPERACSRRSSRPPAAPSWRSSPTTRVTPRSTRRSARLGVQPRRHPADHVRRVLHDRSGCWPRATPPRTCTSSTAT